MDAKYLNKVEEKYITNKKVFRAGDKVRVHVNITEAGKERTQIFEGVVIAIQGKGISKSIVVRKISHGVGVERIFPLSSPNIKKIEIIEKGRARRAKLYYMRERIGKRSLDVIIDESFEGEEEDVEEVVEVDVKETEEKDGDKVVVEELEEEIKVEEKVEPKSEKVVEDKKEKEPKESKKAEK